MKRIFAIIAVFLAFAIHEVNGADDSLNALMQAVDAQLPEVAGLLGKQSWPLVKSGPEMGELILPPGMSRTDQTGSKIGEFNDARKKLFAAISSVLGNQETDVRKSFYENEAARYKEAGFIDAPRQPDQPDRPTRPERPERPNEPVAEFQHITLRASPFCVTATILTNDGKGATLVKRRNTQRGPGAPSIGSFADDFMSSIAPAKSLSAKNFTCYWDATEGQAPPINGVARVPVTNLSARQLVALAFEGVEPRRGSGDTLLISVGVNSTFVAYEAIVDKRVKIQVVEFQTTIASMMDAVNKKRQDVTFMEGLAAAGFLKAGDAEGTPYKPKPLSEIISKTTPILKDIQGKRGNLGPIRRVVLTGEYSRCFAALAPPLGEGVSASTVKVFLTRAFRKKEKGIDPFLNPPQGPENLDKSVVNLAQVVAQEVVREGLNRDQLLCGALIMDALFRQLAVNQNVDDGPGSVEQVICVSEAASLGLLKAESQEH